MTAKVEVVNAFLDGDAIVVASRQGEFRVRPEYSFFVDTSMLDAAFARQLRSSQAVRGMVEEGRYTRIVWADDMVRRNMMYGLKGADGKRHPSPFQERGIPVYEGDVDPIRRWFTDTGNGVAKPVRGFFDIESDSRKTLKEAKEGRARILSLSLSNEDESRTWLGILEAESDEAEKALIAEWWAKGDDFGMEQFLAWNGKNFDFEVLSKRIERLCMTLDMRRRLWLDHMLMFKRMNLNSSDSGDEKQSLALNAIAQSQLGEGKEEVPPEVAARWPGKSLGALAWQLWEAGGEFRALLGRYNMRDTILMPRIEKKTSFAALFDTLCDVCRVLPDTTGLLPTQQMDGFMLRLGHERGFRFPSKKFRDEESDPFKGAFVMEPTLKGILHGVHVADFASLYPSVIITWNMSPETKIGRLAPGHADDPAEVGTKQCLSPMTGICFSTEIEGMLPAALKTMLSLRKEWSDKEASLPPGTPEAKEAKRRSMAYKVAANSFYGVVGSPYSRYFDREVGESVTQNAVWLIKRTIAEAVKRKMNVFYGDTDSFFANEVSRTQFESFVDWCNAELYPEVLREVGCTENRIKLAYEKEFDTIVMVGKKRYAGRFAHFKGSPGRPVPAEGEAFDKAKHSRPEIKGFEYKRGDATVLARRLQEKVIMAMMRDDVRPATYRKFLDEALAHVSKDELPLAEIQQTKSLSKPIREYARKTPKGEDQALPPHVQVAADMVAAGKEIGEGARVSYVIVDGRDGIKAISSDEYTGQIDRYYLWEKQVYPATFRVLIEAFPHEDWITGLERIRPKKPRTGGGPGQGSLFQLADPVTAASQLVIEERVFGQGGEALEWLAAVLREHPGDEPTEVVVQLESGAQAILQVTKTTRRGLERARELARHLSIAQDDRRARDEENRWLEYVNNRRADRPRHQAS